jgi:hypothetical protein
MTHPGRSADVHDDPVVAPDLRRLLSPANHRHTSADRLPSVTSPPLGHTRTYDVQGSRWAASCHIPYHQLFMVKAMITGSPYDVSYDGLQLTQQGRLVGRLGSPHQPSRPHTRPAHSPRCPQNPPRCGESGTAPRSPPPSSPRPAPPPPSP